MSGPPPQSPVMSPSAGNQARRPDGELADAVDAGPDRDRNAVPGARGRPEHGEDIVGDVVLLGPTLRCHRVRESNLLRRQVRAGHEHRRDGSLSAVARGQAAGDPGAIHQVVDDLDGRPEPELVRR